jgi:hypothetical protein
VAAVEVFGHDRKAEQEICKLPARVEP